MGFEKMDAQHECHQYVRQHATAEPLPPAGFMIRFNSRNPPIKMYVKLLNDSLVLSYCLKNSEFSISAGKVYFYATLADELKVMWLNDCGTSCDEVSLGPYSTYITPQALRSANTGVVPVARV